MASTLVLTGDVNLMNVADPEVPFRKIAGDLRAADVVFSNLECCLHLPSPDRATRAKPSPVAQTGHAALGRAAV